jgi:hypothetical protein
MIKKHDLNMIYIAGPGHGEPGVVANVYLEETYSEVYANVSQDEEGMNGSSNSSPSLMESLATSRPKLPALFTRGESWAIQCLTLIALLLIPQTSSLPAWLAMARRKLVRWRQPGLLPGESSQSACTRVQGRRDHDAAV